MFCEMLFFDYFLGKLLRCLVPIFCIIFLIELFLYLFSTIKIGVFCSIAGGKIL